MNNWKYIKFFSLWRSNNCDLFLKWFISKVSNILTFIQMLLIWVINVKNHKNAEQFFLGMEIIVPLYKWRANAIIRDTYFKYITIKDCVTRFKAKHELKHYLNELKSGWKFFHWGIAPQSFISTTFLKSITKLWYRTVLTLQHKIQGVIHKLWKA